MYEAMIKESLIKNENRFNLASDQLGKVVILENVLSMEEARQPLFAKKPTAGNSNTYMDSWKQRAKGKDKEGDKAMEIFNKHM